MTRMNHRRGHRVKTRVEALLTARNDPPIRAVITDLAAGGAFIRLARNVRPASGLIWLEFSLPEPDSRHFGLSALVVRDCAEGIAVMFDERNEALVPARPAPAREAVQQANLA